MLLKNASLPAETTIVNNSGTSGASNVSSNPSDLSMNATDEKSKDTSENSELAADDNGPHRSSETNEPEPVETQDTNHRRQPPLLLPPEVQSRDLREESPPTENEETCLRHQLTDTGGIGDDRITTTKAQSSSIESRSGQI
ncbi:hypothetical protein DY000_02040827 [Brassica cretica]|uniref:Uncharacterized protein n=1 Tax=Brassica cretica TaxID=69181 RepID=A0ABQ7BN19_BRACR|nr:hypothetical protein DY000_02040827 [Brassica cretica]